MPAEINPAPVKYQWQRTGNEVFPAMLTAIRAASHSVCLECYLVEPGELANRFLEALIEARRRGARVRVMVDALGSMNLPLTFFQPLTDIGGEMRQFNPLRLGRLGIRNHRKLLVCDDRVAFVGGYNIASEYEGDGVNRGWCDVGLKIEGPLAAELAGSFEEMFGRAEFRHKRFLRLRRLRGRLSPPPPEGQLLLGGPEQAYNPLKRALRRDLATARNAWIITAYFLPTWRLRHDLARVVREGGQVNLMLPGKSDVALSQLAARSLYRRCLSTEMRIYEYQPQVLHAKLLIIDDVVYVGSANLDQRSLNINYELMVRIHNPEIAAQAREIFSQNLIHCREITREDWRRGRSLWSRLKQRWAYFLLARIDPYIARQEWQSLPD